MFKKTFITAIFILSFAFVLPQGIFSEELADLQNKINEYNQKLSELSKAKDTLANQINILDSQIQLNILKINQTETTVKILEDEIANLTTKIDSLDIFLNRLSSEYIQQINQNYKLNKKIPTFSMFLSKNLNGFLQQYKYISMIQKNSQENLINLETARINYDLQKQEKTKKQAELEALQKKLAEQKNSLARQKASKTSLLEITKNDEKKYQQLLSDAQKQLSSFRRFISGQGGAKILSNQTSCNDWGCYYNQRDSQWGNQLIGLSSDSMAEYGCLITSMAMVASHYGKSVKPSDIAGNVSNFFGKTAYMLQGAISVNGISISRTRVSPSTSNIDSELNAGRPVIVGIKMNEGEHFIVLKSKTNGQYIMNDPYIENGHDIQFTSKYPLSAIYKVDTVRVK